MASSEEDTIDTAALGRPFGLGFLYDCRKDTLIPGITLWDHDELQKNTVERKHQNTEFNITASDSIDEKSNSLKVSGSLKLSLLGGLVNVGGSAKYFQDTKKSLKQERLTLQYKTTTKYETLSMAHLGRGKVSHPNVFENDIATHVVTAILYGASAYFVFDRESSSKDEKKQVEGEAKLMMSKLKFLTVKPQASFNMDEREKSAVENFSCTFHGDFHLSNNPTSFSEAVDVYRQLPKMLGENGEHAVPVRVWLYPLVKLDAKAAKLQRHISNNLITYSSGIIEHLNKTEMRCNDLLNDTAATTFSGMEKKLQALKHNCGNYKVEFVQKLGSVLPSIRCGGKKESALEDILKAHDKSPFNSKDLDQWLTQKEKESDTLKSLLEQLERVGAKMDDNLEYLLCKTSIQKIVSFSFTSIDQPDSFLIKLSNFLKPAGMVREYPESDDLQKTNTDWLSADTRQSIRRQLELFEELKKLTNRDDTKFIVTSKYVEHYPGACIFIYEDGFDKLVPFIPPSKPANPATSDVSYDKLTVGVSVPDSATVEYRVEFRMKQETKWTSHSVKVNQETVALSGLKPDTEYEIRATAVGKLGYAVSSDAVTAVTKAISPPTNAKVSQVKSDSITLTWSNPEQCAAVKQYIIEFKEEGSSDWIREETKTVVNTFTLKDLKQNTTYSIRMCTDAGNGTSKHGNVLKAKIWEGPLDKKRFTPLSDNPPMYLLKMKSKTAGQFKKMVFGKQSLKTPSNKTIMLVGATGSGKTTLINGMVNYILGVEWEDKWRFKLIDEETNKSQAHSQTSEVTAYQIHHTDEFPDEVQYSLTIIDTPGFGDTRGIKQDKDITERIRQFFTNKDGIDAIDGVCFVVQAALARLTHTQKYIFDAIFSVFGKNIANNIITLVTFADGQRPPVLEAIKEANIPCAKTGGSPIHFKFNNSVLFANNTGGNNDEGNFDYMFWRMGKGSMKEFFTQLGTMETQSLTLTKEVLQDRKQLEITVEGVQPLIRQGLSTMEVIRTTQAVLDKHKMKIQENKDFEYEVVVEKSERFDIPTGTFITNCQECNFTCHYPCVYPNDNDKGRCCAMIGGNCTVCPGKCEWSVHYNMTYKWDIKREKEKRTYQELKAKFEAALGEKMSTEKVMAQLTVEYCHVQAKVIDMMTTVTKCLQRLKEIALRPDPLATPDYIDLLIQSEEQEARDGFKQRIKELQEVRQGAVLMQKVAENIALNEKEESKLKMLTSKIKGYACDFLKIFSK